MSKKAWIIGGSSGCSNWGNDYREKLAGAPTKEGETASSAEVITLKVAYTQTMYL